MNTIIHATPGPGANDVAVREELVRALFESVVLPLMNVVVVVISAVVLWPIYPAWIILCWTGASFAVAAFRFALWLRFKRRQQDAGTSASWAFAFTLASAAMGCLWGLLASTVFVTPDPVYTVFAAAVLAGMIAGAATHNSSHLPAYYGFAASAVLPMIVALLTRGAAMPIGMGLMLLTFVAALTVVARDNNRRLVEYIWMKIEQGALNDDLQKLAVDLKHAEGLAREGEAMFRALVEQNMSGILIIAEDATIVFLNPRAVQMIGFGDVSHVVGRHILDFVVDTDQPAAAAAMQAIFEAQDVGEVAIKLRRPRDKILDVLVQGTFGTFREKRVIFAVVVDITERRRAENEIATLNEQMSDTLVVLRRSKHDQTEIARLSDMLQACATTAEAYPIAAAAAESLFPRASGGLARAERGMHDLTRVAAWGPDQMMLANFLIEDCWALRTGQRREVEGSGPAVQCRHFSRLPRGPYICMPLMVQGETIGLLYFGLGEGGVIDDQLRQTMLTFGDVVKLSLMNIEQRELLGQQAIRDHLTSLFNRRYLVETLPREVRRAQRGGSPLTIAMLDIDFFKKFNDEYGHDAGDKVLSEFGLVLKQALREEDIACRYGGEEFVVVLPECDLATARERLLQICLLVKEKAPVFHGRTLPNITLSVGMATLSDALPSAEKLITAADNAMYLAKSNGRDRIEEFQTPGAEGPAQVPATGAPALPAKADETA